MTAKKKKVAKANKKPARRIKTKTRKPKAKPAEVQERTLAAPALPTTVWEIISVHVDNLVVFALANDQRVYRWDSRAALWVLHKDGLTAR